MGGDPGLIPPPETEFSSRAGPIVPGVAGQCRMERIAAMRMPKANTGTAAKTDRQLPLSIGKPIATITPITKMPMMMTRHIVSDLDRAGVVSLTGPLSFRSFPHTVSVRPAATHCGGCHVWRRFSIRTSDRRDNLRQV